MTTPHRVTTILDASGRPLLAGRVNPEVDPLVPRQWVHDPANPTHKDWVRYCDWRITKTPRRDRSNLIERIEDLDQATHELVGEAAELGDCILTHGLDVCTKEQARLVGAIGDLFFRGLWAADAWGHNRFRDAMVPPPSECVPAEKLRDIEALALDEEATQGVMVKLMHLAFQVNVLAGLNGNAFRKARWHQKPVPASTQGDTIAHCLLVAATLAALAGATVEECLEANIKKLDARFPDGFVVGGGIRSGEGA